MIDGPLSPPSVSVSSTSADAGGSMCPARVFGTALRCRQHRHQRRYERRHQALQRQQALQAALREERFLTRANELKSRSQRRYERRHHALQTALPPVWVLGTPASRRHQRRHQQRHQALQTALDAELPSLSARFTLGHKMYRMFQSYRVLESDLLLEIKSFDRTSQLRIPTLVQTTHTPVRLSLWLKMDGVLSH